MTLTITGPIVQSGAWTLTVTNAEWGMVPSVWITATRKCGRTEEFTVSRWFTGWKILRHGLVLPASVRHDAFALARTVWTDECFT